MTQPTFCFLSTWLIFLFCLWDFIFLLLFLFYQNFFTCLSSIYWRCNVLIFFYYLLLFFNLNNVHFKQVSFMCLRDYKNMTARHSWNNKEQWGILVEGIMNMKNVRTHFLIVVLRTFPILQSDENELITLSDVFSFSQLKIREWSRQSQGGGGGGGGGSMAWW